MKRGQSQRRPWHAAGAHACSFATSGCFQGCASSPAPILQQLPLLLQVLLLPGSFPPLTKGQ